MNNLVEIKNLKKYFQIKGEGFFSSKSIVKAVDGISINIKEGQTVGLVGESGCGKSTLGQAAIRLAEPTSGDILFRGRSLLSLGKKELMDQRKKMQIIFQDPYSSLNPRMTVGEILSEPFIIHNECQGRELASRVSQLLETVGLDTDYRKRFPHEFSGGQRQRIGIARSIALNPEFIVADEPVSALDVSIQAQILNLLRDLHKKYNIAFLFVAHDLAVVEHISDWIAVMYLGKIVEEGPAEEIFINPVHPYTVALTMSVPMRPAKKQEFKIKGDLPSPIDPPSGCHFHPRCPLATERCKAEAPTLESKAKHPKHKVACHNV